MGFMKMENQNIMEHIKMDKKLVNTNDGMKMVKKNLNIFTMTTVKNMGNLNVGMKMVIDYITSYMKMA